MGLFSPRVYEFTLKDKTKHLVNGYTVFLFRDTDGDAHWVSRYPPENVFVWEDAKPGDRIEAKVSFFMNDVTYKIINR